MHTYGSYQERGRRQSEEYSVRETVGGCMYECMCRGDGKGLVKVGGEVEEKTERRRP